MSSDSCNNLCRLCLTKDQTLIPILDPLQDSSHDSSQIIDKIGICLSIKISKEDPYSKQICESCIFKIEEFYEFRNITANCQKLLENLARNSKIENQQKESGQKNIRNCSSESLKTSLSTELEETDENGLIGSVEECEEESEEDQESLNSMEIIGITSGITNTISERPVGSSRTSNTTLENTVVPNTIQEKQVDTVVTNLRNTSTSSHQGNILDRCPENENTQTLESSNSGNVAEKNVENPKKSKEYLCNECGKKFKNKEKYCRHIDTHVKVYNCSECTYKSKYTTNFKIHMMKHSGEYLISCKICKKGYYNMQYYRDHFRLKHTNEISTFKCHECGQIYRSKVRLKQHLKYHTTDLNDQRYQCEICGKLCLSYKGMKTHRLTVHEGSRHTCDICNKIVTSLQSLKYHKMRHKREKTHVCDICGKGFIGQSNLLVHKRIHTGERPYKCNLCDRSFTQKITLTVHKRLHSGERPFQCIFCDKRYVCKTNLNRHKKTHKS